MQILLSAKAADISGTVRDDADNPIGGAAVALWPKTRDRGSVSGSVNQAYTDQNGSFKFTSLAPGDYYIAAWEDLESGLAQNPEFLSHFNSVATAITLQESAHVILDPKVIPPARLAAEIAMLP